MDPNSNSSTPIFSPTSNVGENNFVGSSNLDQSTSADKKKKNIIFILIAALLLVATVIVFIFIFNTNTVNSDEQALSIIESYYEDVTGYQKDYIYIINGELDSPNPFNASTKEYIDEMSETMTSFKAEISNIKSEKISKESTRNSFNKLRSDINTKSQTYIDTANLYNLFYKYANDNSSEAKNSLLEISNSAPEVRSIMDSIDSIMNDGNLVLDNNFLQDIFKIYYKNDLTELYYYECMGDIIGGLKNAE